MIDIEYIFAPDPDTLAAQVRAKLSIGWDLYGGISTGHLYALVQCMVRAPAHHEYLLVNSFDLTGLNRQVNQLREVEGYDLHHWLTVWNGKLLQWMSRSREQDLRYIEADYSVSAAPAISQYNVVEHVQKLVRMVPYPVQSPSVLQNSTEGA